MELCRKGERSNRYCKWRVRLVDQLVQIVWHSPLEGIHHEVHPLLYHLHLRDHMWWCRIYDGWIASILLLLSARGIAAFWSFSVSPFGASAFLLLSVTVKPSNALVQLFLQVMVCLVRHSTATTRVCTCLSRAVVRGSSPLLLLVAIERVSTMQLLVWKALIWLLLLSRPFPTNGANWWFQKSSVCCTVLTCSRQNLQNRDKEDLAESTDVVPAKYPQKVKLENLYNSKVTELRKLRVP